MPMRRCTGCAPARSKARPCSFHKLCACSARGEASGPIAERDKELREQVARRLVGEAALGVELVLRLSDQYFRLIDRQHVEEDAGLAQVILRARRAPESGGGAHDGDRLAIERLIRRA